jgi:hypothetical protein
MAARVSVTIARAMTFRSATSGRRGPLPTGSRCRRPTSRRFSKTASSTCRCNLSARVGAHADGGAALHLREPVEALDLARGLTVRVNSVRREPAEPGKRHVPMMRFETSHQDERGAPLEIPGAFLMKIPVFRGNDAYQLAARLRYRVKRASEGVSSGTSFIAPPRRSITRSPRRANRPRRRPSCRSSWASPSPDRRGRRRAVVSRSGQRLKGRGSRPPACGVDEHGNTSRRRRLQEPA